jgi:hypothetical protein
LKLVSAVATVALAALLGCAPVHTYSPAGSTTFGPTTSEIAVLETPPDRPYTVIGYAECRGENVGEALPWLKKMAQENGGNALLKIEAVPVFASLSTYRAAVIRYVDKRHVDNVENADSTGQAP